MGFHDTRLDVAISYGATGGPTFQTSVIPTAGGSEQRIAHWSAARNEYNVATGVQDQIDVAVLDSFFRARQGRAYSFRFKDRFDWTSASDGIATPVNTDQLLGTGDASNRSFPLYKRYTSGSTTVVRTIDKPVSGTVLIALDGVAQTEGVDYNVNHVTGEVTMTTAPGLAVEVTAGYEFDVHVRFDQDQLDISHRSFEQVQSDSIPLIEVVNTDEFDDEMPFGGWHTHGSITTDVSPVLSQGRGHTVNPTVGGLKIILPDENVYPQGNMVMFMYNANATNTIGIYDNDGTTLIHTLATKGMVEVVVRLSAAGTITWDVIA